MNQYCNNAILSVLGEEELSDVGLSTFYVFDKDSAQSQLGDKVAAEPACAARGCAVRWLRRLWLRREAALKDALGIDAKISRMLRQNVQQATMLACGLRLLPISSIDKPAARQSASHSGSSPAPGGAQ